VPVVRPLIPQTQVFKNITALLAASNATPASVLKTTVFLKSMNDFVAFNTLYAEFFGETKPARSCVEVARLPKDVLVEIEWVARIKWFGRVCADVSGLSLLRASELSRVRNRGASRALYVRKDKSA
jgi:hypothetical protein